MDLQDLCEAMGHAKVSLEEVGLGKPSLGSGAGVDSPD